MAYEDIHTERLTFEDELSEQDKSCALCEMSSEQDVMHYMDRLSSCYARSTCERNTWSLMESSWTEYIQKPLEARGINCPHISAKVFENHYTNHNPCTLRILKNGLRRLEKMQDRLHVFDTDPTTGKKLTSERGALSYAKLEAQKQDIVSKIHKILENKNDFTFPIPPDMMD